MMRVIYTFILVKKSHVFFYLANNIFIKLHIYWTLISAG